MTLSFGVSLYPFDRYLRPDSLGEVAIHAEQLGFDTVTIGEHVIVPKANLDLLPPVNFDSLVLGATLAAKTTRIKILFSVLVVPYYHPVRLAKALATLDFFSGGRVVVGVGAGWLAPEFEILGASYAERGETLNESLRILKELWTSDNPRWSGRLTSFKDVTFEPRPAQKPHPPIWVGGWGKNAVRRAVALGDGLYPANAGPLSRLIDTKEKTERMLAEAGRAGDPFTFAHAIDYGRQAGPSHLSEASSVARQPIIFGFDAGPILEHAQAADAAGIAQINVRMPGDDDREVMHAMERFRAEVIEPFGAARPARRQDL